MKALPFTVGQSVWLRDRNRRPDNYTRVTITGETRQSWLVGRDRFSKDNCVIRDGFGNQKLMSDDDKEAEAWHAENVRDFLSWLQAHPINMKRAAEAVGWSKEPA